MLKSCKYCGRIHPEGYVCPRKPVRVRHDDTSTEAAAFRRKNKWKEASIAIRDRDNNLCQLCLRDNKLTYEGTSVHHIHPVAACPDRALDPCNLITLCAYHHKAADAGEIPAEELEQIAAEQETRAVQGD